MQNFVGKHGGERPFITPGASFGYILILDLNK